MRTQTQTFPNAVVRVVTEHGSAVIDFEKRTAALEDPPTPFRGAAGQPPVGEKEPCAGCGTSVKKLISGAIGWTKNALGISVCPPHIQKDRRRICEECPSGCYSFGVCEEVLGGCGCLLPIKIQDSTEECPFQHWTAHAPD